jgi:hypothetical protein
VKQCSNDLIRNAMWIRIHVTGSFQDQFDEICGLVEMIEDIVRT